LYAYLVKPEAEKTDMMHMDLPVLHSLICPEIIGRENHLGNWRMNQEFPLEALADHCEVLTIFESLGEKRGIAKALGLLGGYFIQLR